MKKVSDGIYRQTTECGQYIIQVCKRDKNWKAEIRDTEMNLVRACREMGGTKKEALEIALEDYEMRYSPA
jgi:hypothetical protein